MFSRRLSARPGGSAPGGFRTSEPPAFGGTGAVVPGPQARTSPGRGASSGAGLR
ncbi:hypothetical protein GCM10028832_38970 [Streptomyces sparsus]